jgi:ABC-2 type transport system ATP-binding protein
MSALVELEEVTKLYGAQQALGPVTLTVPEGTVGLLGPNGAGKSTLVRLMLGLIQPTSGTVRVLGEEPGTRALRRRIGYVPEGEAIFPDMTGVEAVTYAGRLVGMHPGDALQRAHQVLDYVELSEARYRMVEKYSTGMKQRLKLAQALVHDPDLLILDEPTEGVDPEVRLRLLEFIHELSKEYGIQILLSTHILPDVERLASHVVVLNAGRVAAHGSLQELRAQRAKGYLVRVHGPADAFTEALTRKGIPWTPAPPNIQVAAEDPRAVLRALNEAGVVVRHLAPLEVSLGEAFEQAVEGQANA